MLAGQGSSHTVPSASLTSAVRNSHDSSGKLQKHKTVVMRFGHTVAEEFITVYMKHQAYEEPSRSNDEAAQT